MIIPEVVRIGSCYYDVIFTDKDLVANHQECYACVDYNKHVIEINSLLGDEQLNELSLLHEMFHVILKDRGIEVENEEFIVEELAKGLHQVILDNPHMFLEVEITESE
jgi:Zn-dependent peptidase ImmA (M78 family)